jgi:hypothetical protein
LLNLGIPSAQLYVITSDTAPVSPVDGMKWVDLNTGIEYTWVDDGNSGQWIEVGASGYVQPAAEPDVFETEIADFTDATYFYYGGMIGPEWKINRFVRTTGIKTSAQLSNNPGYLALSTAWTARASLSYA